MWWWKLLGRQSLLNMWPLGVANVSVQQNKPQKQPPASLHFYISDTNMAEEHPEHRVIVTFTGPTESAVGIWTHSSVLFLCQVNKQHVDRPCICLTAIIGAIKPLNADAEADAVALRGEDVSYFTTSALPWLRQV